MIKGHNIINIQALNGHNPRVYSGLEYVYVAPLNEQQFSKMVELIRSQKLDNKVYGTFELSINKMFSTGDIAEKDKDVQESKIDQLDEFNWLPIPIDRKKSSYNSKSQGEKGGKSYSNTLNLHVTGASQLTTEFFNALLNNEFAIIFKDANGNYRLMFDECYNNQLELEQNTGEGLSAETGFTVTVTNESKYPSLYIYGKFRLSSAIVTTDDETKGYNDIAIINTGKDPSANDSKIFDQVGVDSSSIIEPI